MAELPRVMATRFVLQYGLSASDATQLTQSQSIAQYFENVTQCGIDAVETSKPEMFQTRNVGNYWRPRFAKLAGNWIMGEVSKWLNSVEDYTFEQFTEFVPAGNLAALIVRIDDDTISSSSGKTAFSELLHAPGTKFATSLAYIDSIIEELGLRQMNDSSELEKIVDEVLAANLKNVAEYKAGNSKALNALVGQIMKGSKGKANPQQVNDLLRRKLD